MIYSSTEIGSRIAPVAKEFDVKKMILFGSYARGEASEESDIDFLYQHEGSKVKGLLSVERFRQALEQALGKRVDLISMESLDVAYNQEHRKFIVDGIRSNEEIVFGL
ncbi:nucleotidyltransferase family protein [Weissella cibaria]|uniref:nucleotidyltransferase family protein n=1 Tax=Weissella cibaria TaxID=137591 RepID=UPI00215B3338|nr:nucleotidyltransferase domain-containing protein [Weissella cibaria]MCR8702492.1 nucleotidyltransferase domain-containing protein [Weissella cibaria]